MAVKLETVINAMDLATEVLTAAAGVIEGAKQLGVDVDVVGGAVMGAADGAANGVRAVADGLGLGLGVHAHTFGRSGCLCRLQVSSKRDAVRVPLRTERPR